MHYCIVLHLRFWKITVVNFRMNRLGLWNSNFSSNRWLTGCNQLKTNHRFNACTTQQCVWHLSNLTLWELVMHAATMKDMPWAAFVHLWWDGRWGSGGCWLEGHTMGEFRICTYNLNLKSSTLSSTIPRLNLLSGQMYNDWTRRSNRSCSGKKSRVLVSVRCHRAAHCDADG